MDLYNILNLNQNASQNEIKHAYLKLAKIYHPDKNNSLESHDKFIEIHTAYEILYNNNTNKNYNNMDNTEKLNFYDFLNKFVKLLGDKNSSELLNNSDKILLKLEEIEKYFYKLCKTDINYIKENFINFIHEINIIELFEIFYNGKLLKKKNYLTYSDTDSEINNEYYYILPIYLQKNNDLDIKIDVLINLNDIIDDCKKKIKIKRKINNEIIISTFIFNLSHPFIVFYDGGDSNNKNTGNLIIKIILPNNVYWNDNILFIDYPMTLYELIYGIDINNIIQINNWIPYKHGFSIDISKNINIIIKLYLNYDDNIDNHNILKQYFHQIKN